MHVVMTRFIQGGAILLLLTALSTPPTYAQVNDSLYDEQGYLQAINADQAWTVTTGSPDVRIAVIGGGNVLPTHEDLGAKTTIGLRSAYAGGEQGSFDCEEFFCYGESLLSIPYEAQPTLGTSVAGIAAAITNNHKGIAGVNWSAPILSYDPATLLETDGVPAELGLYITDLGMVDDAISDAANRADILVTLFQVFPREWEFNVQVAIAPDAQDGQVPESVPVIGGTWVNGFLWKNRHHILSFFEQLAETDTGYRDAVRSVRDAYVQGRTIVAPAGDFNGTTGGLPAGFSDDGLVITVGSVDSGFDSPYQYSASSATNIDVVAPGVSVKSTVNTGSSAYGNITSTSMSVGLVGGVASLLDSYDPDLRPEDIRQVLRRTAVDVGSPGRDARTGFGRIDAAAALDYVQERTFTRGVATNGTATTVYDGTVTLLHGTWGQLAAGTYFDVEKRKVTFTVPLPAGEQDPHVWVRLAGSRGWSAGNPNDQARWAQVESIDTQNGTVTFSTYVYGNYVYDVLGRKIYNEWFPVSPHDAKVAYTIAGTSSPQPPPPPVASVVGSTCIDHGYTGTFCTNVQSGKPPFSYYWERHYCSGGIEPLATTGGVSTQDLPPGSCQWVGLVGGNGSSVDIPNMTEDYDLRVTVTDALGRADPSPTFHVDVEPMCFPGSQGTSAGETASADQQASPDAAEAGMHAEAGTGRSAAQPDSYALEPAYPNPLSSRTTVRFALPEATDVDLVVYDALGREVGRLVDGRLEAGYHEAVFEAANRPSGVYLYELRAGSFRETGRMVLTK